MAPLNGCALLGVRLDTSLGLHFLHARRFNVSVRDCKVRCKSAVVTKISQLLQLVSTTCTSTTVTKKTRRMYLSVIIVPRNVHHVLLLAQKSLKFVQLSPTSKKKNINREQTTTMTSVYYHNTTSNVTIHSVKALGVVEMWRRDDAGVTVTAVA